MPGILKNFPAMACAFLLYMFRSFTVTSRSAYTRSDSCNHSLESLFTSLKLSGVEDSRPWNTLDRWRTVNS